MEADKLQRVPGSKGFLPKRKQQDQDIEGFVDYSLLTTEELEMRK
jgi:hypothetical protein